LRRRYLARRNPRRRRRRKPRKRKKRRRRKMNRKSSNKSRSKLRRLITRTSCELKRLERIGRFKKEEKKKMVTMRSFLSPISLITRETRMRLKMDRTGVGKL